MRVPPHQLLVSAARDALEVALSTLLEKKGQEVDLEEEVAELVEELRRLVSMRSVRHLVCLFDRVRHDRARGLLTIPGAIAAQPPGQLLEVEKRLREGHAEDVTRSRSAWCPGARAERTRSHS